MCAKNELFYFEHRGNDCDILFMESVVCSSNVVKLITYSGIFYLNVRNSDAVPCFAGSRGR
jgi:hypothetical protein